MLRNEPVVVIAKGQQGLRGRQRARRGVSKALRGPMEHRALAITGFSLVEVLIASVLLLIIALGIIPLFVRSVGLNQEGRFASLATAVASSEIERLTAAPFNSPDMTIAAGQTEILFQQWQEVPRGEWIDEADWTAGGGFSFHRIIRVRQFGLAALGDGKLEESEAINGNTGASNPGLVQLKEIVVQVESGRFPGTSSKQVTLRSLRGI